jgi:hypothetical protein
LNAKKKNDENEEENVIIKEVAIFEPNMKIDMSYYNIEIINTASEEIIYTGSFYVFPIEEYMKNHLDEFSMFKFKNLETIWSYKSYCIKYDIDEIDYNEDLNNNCLNISWSTYYPDPKSDYKTLF